MISHKQKAAHRAAEIIKAGQVVGIGDGSTMLTLLDIIAGDKNRYNSVTFTSPSEKSLQRMAELGISYCGMENLMTTDLYFDGCDAFDSSLNALKSGSGIHSREKIAASMSAEFILVADDEKYTPVLSPKIPLLVEVFPVALSSILHDLYNAFPKAIIQARMLEHEKFLSPQGNYLLEMYPDQYTALGDMDRIIKMMPGVANHSLFYQLASRAIIAGPQGLRELFRM